MLDGIDEFEIEVRKTVGLWMTLFSALGLLVGAVEDTPATTAEILAAIFFLFAISVGVLAWKSIVEELR